MNLVKLYDNNTIQNLSKGTVLKFQQFLEDNKVQEKDYYDSIPDFVESLHYTQSTKKAYRNRLRRLLYAEGYL